MDRPRCIISQYWTVFLPSLSCYGASAVSRATVGMTVRSNSRSNGCTRQYHDRELEFRPEMCVRTRSTCGKISIHVYSTYVNNTQLLSILTQN